MVAARYSRDDSAIKPVKELMTKSLFGPFENNLFMLLLYEVPAGNMLPALPSHHHTLRSCRGLLGVTPDRLPDAEHAAYRLVCHFALTRNRLVVRHVEERGRIDATVSWGERGLYTWPHPPSWAQAFLSYKRSLPDRAARAEPVQRTWLTLIEVYGCQPVSLLVLFRRMPEPFASEVRWPCSRESFH